MPLYMLHSGIWMCLEDFLQIACWEHRCSVLEELCNWPIWRHSLQICFSVRTAFLLKLALGNMLSYQISVSKCTYAFYARWKSASPHAPYRDPNVCGYRKKSWEIWVSVRNTCPLGYLNEFFSTYPFWDPMCVHSILHLTCREHRFCVRETGLPIYIRGSTSSNSVFQCKLPLIETGPRNMLKNLGQFFYMYPCTLG